VAKQSGDDASVVKFTKDNVDHKGVHVSEKLFSKNALRFYSVPAQK
jgi:predicted TIM-barrel fold metal-dependent hydrolase